nr:site-specific integrase [Roseovarius nanhaiticus]
MNDPKTVGLLLKVTPAGRKVFVYRYRTLFGRQRKLTVGKLGEISVSTARRKAKELAVEVSNGADPASDRINQRNAMTVAEFAAIYLRDQAKRTLAPSTFKEYERVLESRVVPKIGKLPLVELTRLDIESLHASMSSAPIRANRMLSVVKAMLFKAEDWDVIPRGSNPASRVKMNKERPKQHYFSDTEQARIFRAIEAAQKQMPRSKVAFEAITLLFFTGCRPSEVLRLRWEDIDLGSGVATLHSTKTGEGRLLLANAAVNFLQSIASSDHRQGWVFPGVNPEERLKTLTKPWKRTCDLAGLPNACLKDIRHTVGTYVARTGGLHSAQAILRHTSPITTRRYAHPFETAVRGDLENAITSIETNRRSSTSYQQDQPEGNKRACPTIKTGRSGNLRKALKRRKP